MFVTLFILALVFNSETYLDDYSEIDLCEFCVLV